MHLSLDDLDGSVSEQVGGVGLVVPVHVLALHQVVHPVCHLQQGEVNMFWLVIISDRIGRNLAEVENFIKLLFIFIYYLIKV